MKDAENVFVLKTEARWKNIIRLKIITVIRITRKFFVKLDVIIDSVWYSKRYSHRVTILIPIISTNSALVYH